MFLQESPNQRSRFYFILICCRLCLKKFCLLQWYWPLFGVTLNFKWARSTCGDEKIVSKKVFVHSEIKISDFLNWQTLSTVGELYYILLPAGRRPRPQRSGDVQLHTLHFNRDAILTSLPHSTYHIYNSLLQAFPALKVTIQQLLCSQNRNESKGFLCTSKI